MIFFVQWMDSDGFVTNSGLPFHIIMNQSIIWNMQDNTWSLVFHCKFSNKLHWLNATNKDTQNEGNVSHLVWIHWYPSSEWNRYTVSKTEAFDSDIQGSVELNHSKKWNTKSANLNAYLTSGAWSFVTYLKFLIFLVAKHIWKFKYDLLLKISFTKQKWKISLELTYNQRYSKFQLKKILLIQARADHAQ